MANEEHVALLRQWVDAWNEWREANPEVEPDLSYADFCHGILRDADLSSADLYCANLYDADLNDSTLEYANLYGANLKGSTLNYAILRGADLRDANLEDANLRKAKLFGANLCGANLCGANLSYADLSGTDISYANFEGANLEGICLRGANLEGANLRGNNLGDAILRGNNLADANLENADLIGANLEGANLRGAALTCAQLINANLENADLTGASIDLANLSGANLESANLGGAKLYESNLWNTKLISADLTGAILLGADLTGADLTGANLTSADLSRVQALGTNFKGATLTGACIREWHINAGSNLESVICDYVYLKDGALIRKWSERRPHTGTFAPGEFTKLFQEAHNTIDLIFKEGLNWKAFAYSFRQVEVLYEDAHLEVRSIENKGDGVVIVKVAAAPGVDKGQIYTDFTQMYEVVSKTLAAQYEARLLDKDTQLREQSTYINRLLRLVDSSQEVQRVMAENTGDTYNIGELKTGGFAPRGIASNNTFNDFSNAQDLTQAAAQIQSLLAQLQQQGQSPEAAQQQVADDLAKQADQNPALLGKLVKWGQKLGDATVTDVVKGVVKLALRSAGVPLP